MTVSSSPHNPNNSVIVRLRLFNEVGVLNRVTQKISDLGGISSAAGFGAKEGLKYALIIT